jgi:hypothetical protein
MIHELLAVRTAKKYVKNYNDESDALMQARREAMDCRDCEDFLQLGIDAFHWIIAADCKVRLALKDGNFDEFESQQSVLEILARLWLQPCKYAEHWIQLQQQAGNEPDNLVLFGKCCAEMTSIVNSYEPVSEIQMTAALQNLQDYALDEFEHDKAVPFL